MSTVVFQRCIVSTNVSADVVSQTSNCAVDRDRAAIGFVSKRFAVRICGGQQKAVREVPVKLYLERMIVRTRPYEFKWYVATRAVNAEALHEGSACLARSRSSSRVEVKHCRQVYPMVADV